MVVVLVFSISGVLTKNTYGNLHIDPIAEMYVIGCTIDYVTELGGSFLKVSTQMLRHLVVVEKVLLFSLFITLLVSVLMALLIWLTGKIDKFLGL